MYTRVLYDKNWLKLLIMG